jgi:hypothetical protein
MAYNSVTDYGRLSCILSFAAKEKETISRVGLDSLPAIQTTHAIVLTARHFRGRLYSSVAALTEDYRATSRKRSPDISAVKRFSALPVVRCFPFMDKFCVNVFTRQHDIYAANQDMAGGTYFFQ